MIRVAPSIWLPQRGQWRASDVPGNILCLDGDYGVLDTGGDVDQWIDRSPARQTVTQVAPNRPTTGAVLLNGHRGVKLVAASSQWLDVASLVGSGNDWTAIAVIDQDASTGSPQTLFGFTSDLSQTAIVATATDVDYVGGYDSGSGWLSATPIITGPQLLVLVFDSTTLTLSVYRNGQLLGVEVYDGVLPIVSDMKIGRHRTIATQYGNYSLYTLALFNRLLTTAEEAQATTALMAKYGLRFEWADIAGPMTQHDLRKTSTLTLNGSKIITIADYVAGSKNITQGTDSKRPIYHTSGGPNDQPYAIGDGVDDLLQETNALAQPTTILTAIRPSNAGSVPVNKTLFDGGTLINTGRLYSNPTTLDDFNCYAGAAIGPLTLIPTNWQYLTIVFDGASGSMGVNGGTPVAGNVGANAHNGLTLFNNPNGTQATNSSYAVFVRYERHLNTYEIAAAEWAMERDFFPTP